MALRVINRHPFPYSKTEGSMTTLEAKVRQRSELPTTARNSSNAPTMMPGEFCQPHQTGHSMCNMYRALAALLISGAIVSAILLALFHEMGPFPFFFLLPGVVVSALIPGLGFNIKSGIDWWGTPSGLMASGVNILFYAGVAYLILSFSNWPRRVRK